MGDGRWVPCPTAWGWTRLCSFDVGNDVYAAAIHFETLVYGGGALLVAASFLGGGGGGGCVVRNRPCVEKQLEIAELCDMCVASGTLDVRVNFSPHLHLLRKVSCAFSWSVERRGLFRDGCMTARGHRQRTAWVCFARL